MLKKKEGESMTVEEIEIIVTAQVEEALKKFQKFLPTIKQTIRQAQEAFSKVDTRAMTSKLHQAVNFMKKKMQNLKKSSENNEIAIKVNNKDAQKQISQVQKQIDSLQEKINARQMKLNVINPQIDKIVDDTRKSVTPEGINPNDKAMDTTVNNALGNNKDFTVLNNQAQKLYTEIEMYNKQLSEAKNKMTQLKQEINQTAISQGKLTSFFSGFKQKIDQVKPSISKMRNSFKGLPKVTQNITNNIKGMGTGLKNGLGHVLKYAMALFSLRGIYSILSGCANAWLSSQNAGAKQLSENINYMKYAMGSVLAPVIQFVTNLVYQLMKAIQSVAYVLTGVNIFAKASASSYANMAGSAKKAKQETKALAGVHSEINNISDKDNSDGGSGGTTTPSFDLSKMDNQMMGWVDKIKKKLLLLFKPIQKSWSQYGKPLLKSMEYAFNSNITLIKTMGKSFKEVWLNGTGEKTLGIYFQALTSIFNIIGNINIAFANAWQNNGGTETIQQLWNGFNNLLLIVQDFYRTIEEWTSSENFQEFANSIIGICETLSGWFELVTQKLKEIWDNGGRETFSKLLGCISKLVTAISSIISFLSPVIEFVLNIVTPAVTEIIKVIGYVIDALSGLLDFIIGVFTGDWGRAWNGIKEFFIGIWNALKTAVATILNIIKDSIVSVLNVIKNIWNTVWSWIKQLANTIWNGIKTIISNAINGIKNTISNVLNGIKNIWNNVWNGLKTTVTNIFNGIWNTIKRIINSILGGIEGMANGVVKGINKVISVMNNLSFDIPDWVPGMGGKKFGFNIGYMSEVSLPRLAKGNVAYEKTLAIFGEYAGASNNPEITAPQNIMRETFEDVLSNYNNENSDRPINLTVNVGSTKLGQILLDNLRDMKRQSGKDIEALVGG
jgi:phage-related protein